MENHPSKFGMLAIVVLIGSSVFASTVRASLMTQSSLGVDEVVWASESLADDGPHDDPQHSPQTPELLRLVDADSTGFTSSNSDKGFSSVVLFFVPLDFVFFNVLDTRICEFANQPIPNPESDGLLRPPQQN